MEEFSKKLNVRVLTPEDILWEGEAESVSSENESGPFDILPEHANFLSLIIKKPVIVHIGEKDKTFDFDQSVIHVENDNVSVFGNISSSLKKEDVEKIIAKDEDFGEDMAEKTEKESDKSDKSEKNIENSEKMTHFKLTDFRIPSFLFVVPKMRRLWQLKFQKFVYFRSAQALC